MPNWARSACNRLDQIWTEGGNDLYISGYTWHNRATYSKEQINGFNELAWGGGYGRSIYDETVIGRAFTPWPFWTHTARSNPPRATAS